MNDPNKKVLEVLIVKFGEIERADEKKKDVKGSKQ